MFDNKIISHPGCSIQGEMVLPGDKSITHRALILSAISNFQVSLSNWLNANDCLATKAILENLGIKFLNINNKLKIAGVGLYGLTAPNKILNVGNSGTTIRLLAGLLAAQKFDSILTGDEHILKRPMARVKAPLEQMGAKISLVRGQFPPIEIFGAQKIRAINYNSPIASAQVKSAIILAGLYANGKTTVTTPLVCRDHTERMLAWFNSLEGTKNNEIELSIPGDISTAANFILAATIIPNSKLKLKNVGVNPTRTGFIEILKLMGADISFENLIDINNEPRADIVVKSSKLKGVRVPDNLVPNAIDELPLVMIAGAVAQGFTQIRNAKELRYKESDRIQAMADGLSNIDIKTETCVDGIDIIGGKFKGGVVDSKADHRIAMAFAIAGCVAKDSIEILDCKNIATSNPLFLHQCEKLGLRVYAKITDIA